MATKWTANEVNKNVPIELKGQAEKDQKKYQTLQEMKRKNRQAFTTPWRRAIKLPGWQNTRLSPCTTILYSAWPLRCLDTAIFHFIWLLQYLASLILICSTLIRKYLESTIISLPQFFAFVVHSCCSTWPVQYFTLLDL